MKLDIDCEILLFSQAFLYLDENAGFSAKKYTPADVVMVRNKTPPQDTMVVTTLDNRRMYRAKKASLSQLTVHLHGLTDPLPQPAKLRFAFSISFPSRHGGCYTFDLLPKCWGGALVSRCCLQTADFPLFGCSMLPQIQGRRRSTHYWQDDTKSTRCFVKRDDAQWTEMMVDFYKESNQIVGYLGKGVPTICNIHFQNFIREQLEKGVFFEILDKQVLMWHNYCFLPANPNVDEEETDRLLCERERELLMARDEEYDEALLREEMHTLAHELVHDVVI